MHFATLIEEETKKKEMVINNNHYYQLQITFQVLFSEFVTHFEITADPSNVYCNNY